MGTAKCAFTCTPVSCSLLLTREKLELPPIYFAHQRQVIPRNGLLVPLTDLTPAKEGEIVETRTVRFRTVGDISCTCPVASDADTLDAIIAEKV